MIFTSEQLFELINIINHLICHRQYLLIINLYISIVSAQAFYTKWIPLWGEFNNTWDSCYKFIYSCFKKIKLKFMLFRYYPDF